jgi:gluconate 2-dehydrogenase gamma chain
MHSSGRSRREFLLRSVSGLSATWVATNYTEILEAGHYAQASALSEDASAYAFFTPAQAAEVEAMAAQIIPTDDTPGARDARVIRFIDRALVTFDRARQADYTRGLDLLQAQTARTVPGASRFAALSSVQQVDVLTAMEQTPFFQLVRTHTITGFFAHPMHGGNHGKVGWTLVGWDDSLDHTPPFGYYDALPQFRR